MKAFLLAAGKGRRLGPITEQLPKCLVPIRGEPLLAIWLSLLSKHGISEVLINLHHHRHLVEGFLRSHPSRLAVKTFHEGRLLGTAGTVAANRKFVQGERAFFIIYADMLTDVDLGKMADFHLRHGGLLTISLYRTPTPEGCGIAEVNRNGVVTRFVEKPRSPTSNLANTGLYVASQGIFDYITDKFFLDFAFDVLPGLAGKMYGYIIEDFLLDIGTLQNYERAQREWKAL